LPEKENTQVPIFQRILYTKARFNHPSNPTERRAAEMPVYNVLLVAEFHDIQEGDQKDVLLRMEEHGFEKIPTVSNAWEMKCEGEDETDAKDKAIQSMVNICRTHPFELKMVAHAGESQILRRRKKFEA
jgi:hypothetical protein